MKKYFNKSLFVLSLCLGACTSEDVWDDEKPLMDDGEISKIEAVAAAFDWEGLKSRNTITMGGVGEIEKPVWANKDTIGIYPTTGDQLSFPIVDGIGTSTCEFNGGGWALKASSKYTAYYPFNRAYYYKKNHSLPISMLGQFQEANDDTDHLSKYDIQTAVGETLETGKKVKFEFNHQVCIVRMDLKVPEDDVEWTSIKLLSNALFTTEATMDLSAETPVITATATSNNVTLKLDWIETNNTLTAYMIMLPVDFTGKDLKIVLSGTRGTYIADAVIANDNRNFAAGKARWITASSFTSHVQVDYSWYDSSKDIYNINNESQLNALSKIANGDTYALSKIGASEAPTFEGKTINLTNDINLLSLESWTPIKQFSGTFNGNNYTIKNLYCRQKGSLGLFKNVSNATIKNLKVDGSIVSNLEKLEGGQSLYFGGISAWASNTVFENCISNVDITTSGSGEDFVSIGCSIGGICGQSYGSTYIACQSSSVISDDHSPKEWGYYIGGIVGHANGSYSEYDTFIACAKLIGDVKELNRSSYSFVGGIVGYSSESSSSNPQNRLRACYTAIDVKGKQPGLIVGYTTSGNTYASLNASACYYSGNGYGMGGETYGVGNDYYGGYERSYDSGTARSTDLDETISSMNAAIDEWNTENPTKICNYKYVNGVNGLELVVN